MKQPGDLTLGKLLEARRIVRDAGPDLLTYGDIERLKLIRRAAKGLAMEISKLLDKNLGGVDGDGDDPVIR